jgi:erythromycin esterase-like protein
MKRIWIMRRPVGLLLALGLLLAILPAQAQDTTETEAELSELAAVVEDIAYVVDAADDYAPILERVGDAHLVLIGEATHGTHEFYRTRAELTRMLIEEKGFTGVAIEGNWPTAYRVNRYVRGEGEDATAEEALSSFTDFPTWMWRNTDVRDFVEWLRTYNADQTQQAQAGFYGLDLYSLYESQEAVIAYAESADPQLAAQITDLYACFEGASNDPQRYGARAASGLEESCEQPAESALAALKGAHHELVQADADFTDDLAYFEAEQNARVVVNGERYYRTAYAGGESSWNLRDSHMMETLDTVLEQLEAQGSEARLVVWAHNSHVGDARATEMGEGGQHNIGQLVRQQYGEDAYLIGFSTYHGTVRAADNWGSEGELKTVQPGLPGSYEDIFHRVGLSQFFIFLDQEHAALERLREQRLQRAIGVIYLPETERFSHYFYATLPEQFDVLIHIDRTQALEPLPLS